MAWEDLEDIEVTSTEKKDFPVVPEGVYSVQITNISKVVGKKWVDGKLTDEEETKMLFEFTVLNGDHSGEKVFTRTSTKLGDTPGKESTLYKLSCAALGRKLERNEQGSFEFHKTDLKEAILQIIVKVEEREGKKYNKIADFLKEPKLETKKK